MSTYYETLIKSVLDNSESMAWKEAVKEWEIYDCEEDAFAEESCVCGKENLKYLYKIKNIINGKYLYPIGSSCIRKFERNDLKSEVSVREGMFRLLHAIQADEYISLTSDLFSRKLLRHLYDAGAFENNKYNDFEGKNDYEFVLKMFNKRDKATITSAQNRKVRAIIVSSIKPYLIKVLALKIR